MGVALFAILGTVSSVMLLSAMRGARKAAAINIAKNEGQFALNAMVQTTRFAKNAVCSGAVTLTKTDDTTVVYDLAGGVITEQVGAETNNLTGEKVTVTACGGSMFTCNGRNVQICFNIDSATASDVTESAGSVGTGIMFTTTVVLRNWGI